MTATLWKIASDFSTTLNLKTAIWATSATLDSATDDDGVALPTGTYFLTLDRKSANKEYIKCTLTSTALTDIYHVSRQGALTSGTTKTHRKGATVEITDFAIIKKMLDLLDGTTDLNASVPLKYDGTATISNANHLATKAYVDGVAIAGGADASTTVKGITKLSTAPASASNPIAVGDNDGRVPTQDENDALAGTSGTPSSTNKYVTADDVAENTASKVVRRKSDSNITVPTTPTASTDASSKAYTDTFLNQYLPGNFTQDANTSTTTTIAHGFGRTPKLFSIRWIWGSGSVGIYSDGSYDGTNSKCVFRWHDTNGTLGGTNKDSTASIWISYASSSGSGLTKYIKGVVTWDATNVTITWTAAGGGNSSLSIDYIYEIYA